MRVMAMILNIRFSFVLDRLPPVVLCDGPAVSISCWKLFSVADKISFAT